MANKQKRDRRTAGGRAVLGDITTIEQNILVLTPAHVQEQQGQLPKNVDGKMGMEIDENEVDDGARPSSAAQLRMRPDIALFYRTPGMLRFHRRRESMALPIDYFAKYPVPDEVIGCIFDFLNHRDLLHAVLTCKKFLNVGYNPKFWSFLDLCRRSVTESGVHSLVDRGVQVLRLSQADIICDMVPRADSILLYPEMEMARLTHLDLGMTLSADGTHFITGILQRCGSLQALSLEGGQLDERICVAIAYNSKLRYLNLALCSGINPEGLRAICEGCREMWELNVAWNEFDNAHVRILADTLPPSLIRLNISGIRQKKDFMDHGCFDFMTVICIADFLDLIHSCPRLEELDVSDAPSLTESSIAYLLHNTLPRLRVLGLSRCYGIEPSAFLLGAPDHRQLTQLQELKVFGCVTDAGIEVLQRRLMPTLVNQNPQSDVARPTTGVRRTSIWGQRVREID